MATRWAICALLLPLSAFAGWGENLTAIMGAQSSAPASAPAYWTDPFSPVALYRFESDDGTSAMYRDDSGNNHSLSNYPAGKTGPMRVVVGTNALGETRYGVKFGGYNYLGSTNRFGLNTNTVSMGAWVRVAQNKALYQRYFNAYQPGGAAPGVGMYWDGTTNVVHGHVILKLGGYSMTNAPATSWGTNSWHFISMTYSNRVLSVYGDGVLGFTRTSTDTMNTNYMTAFFVGGIPGYSQYNSTNTLMDRVCVYTQALSEADWLDIAQHTHPTNDLETPVP